MIKMKKYIWIIAIAGLFIACKAGQPSYIASSEEQIPEQVPARNLTEYPGFINMYWDKNSGRIWLKVNRLDEEFLYITVLRTGLGSNDIGLDRGLLGRERVVKFIRNGPKLMLIQPNYAYRAESDNPAEARAVREAFAFSILWGFQIQEYKTDGYLVDATDFFLQDAQHVTQAIRDARQGKYTLDLQKSGINEEGLKNFQDNTEIEALLTFKGDPEGGYICQVAPTPGLVTVIQRHSMVRLPDEGYEKRAFDPRAGYFGILYYDYATPIDDPLAKRYICRHRLKKRNSAEERSEAVEPVIYYLDPGVPEPVRSALLEGASWWNEAFEAAGYIDAFQVKMLPEDADPLDVRYNVIQWVHRSTRGWSYGSSVVDPRTGEIIKGHVSLGSLRVRQDLMIAQGLLSPFRGEDQDTVKAREMALARIRQLSAHEVGHTLGLAHNYASSANDRASVMDYPHPLISLSDEGEIDLSKAYTRGIGEWDKIAIRYGYSDFTDQMDEKTALEKIIHEAIARNLYFISDRDARPAGSAHPYAHLWDNQLNAADELNRMIEIRKIVIDNFGVNSIPEGTPFSSLEDVFVPVYLMHRYQLEAAGKVLGGLFYSYAIKGDSQVVTEQVPTDNQFMALDAIIRTLLPEFLKIPENILQLMPPKAMGYEDSRENFNRKTGLTFDPLTAIESAANLSLSMLLNQERAARLVEYHARRQEQPSLDTVIRKIIENTWYLTYADSYEAEINRTVSKLVLKHMMELASDTGTAGQVKAITLAEIMQLDQWLSRQLNKKDPGERAHNLYAQELIRRFREQPDLFKPAEVKELPVGPPIGTGPLGCDF
ncbi:MAG: zinc-dependent metalloprotease [Cyclobacteriaceae bacterium]|nr:zinc-dependent metalloprotease [Cyclobacteriaceae bacterium]